MNKYKQKSNMEWTLRDNYYTSETPIKASFNNFNAFSALDSFDGHLTRFYDGNYESHIKMNENKSNR